VLACIAVSFRSYDPGISLVGSCSAAISAACHRPSADTMAYERPVMWGVVDEANVWQGASGVGHCCLTSFEVTKPVEGRLYAGLKEE
jgi:hypothetical protein